MRLAAQAKGGFYPTPDRVVDMIADLIHTPSSYYHSRRQRRCASSTPAAGPEKRWRNWPSVSTGPTLSPSRPTASSCTGTGLKKRLTASTAHWPQTCSPRP